MALNVPYSILSFGKIVRAVSEKLLRTDERTNGRTNGGDFIGPFGFQPGTNNGIYNGIYYGITLKNILLAKDVFTNTGHSDILSAQ